MHIDAEFEGELQLHPSDHHGQSEPTDTSAPKGMDGGWTGNTFSIVFQFLS
jgi:hypothetical protein